MTRGSPTSTGPGPLPATVASAGTRTAAAAPAGPAAFDPEKYLPAVPGEIDVVQSYDAAEAAPMNGIHPDKPWLALGPGPVPLADAHPQWWAAFTLSLWSRQIGGMAKNARASVEDCCQSLGPLAVGRGVGTPTQILDGWSLQGIVDGPRNAIAARERAGWGDAAIADDLAPGVLTFPAKTNRAEPDQHHRLIRPLSRGRCESGRQSETNKASALYSSPANALLAISKFASPSHAV